MLVSNKAAPVGQHMAQVLWRARINVLSPRISPLNEQWKARRTSCHIQAGSLAMIFPRSGERQGGWCCRSTPCEEGQEARIDTLSRHQGTWRAQAEKRSMIDPTKHHGSAKCQKMSCPMRRSFCGQVAWLRMGRAPKGCPVDTKRPSRVVRIIQHHVAQEGPSGCWA